MKPLRALALLAACAFVASGCQKTTDANARLSNSTMSPSSLPDSRLAAHERLAIRVMNAIDASDMSPVDGNFVPERQGVLHDRALVARVHALATEPGTYAGMHEVSYSIQSDGTQLVVLDAIFKRGYEEIQMTLDPKSGKIVHYHLSDPRY